MPLVLHLGEIVVLATFLFREFEVLGSYEGKL